MDTEEKIGRPSKLTPELQEKICKYIAAGNYTRTACMMCNISEPCYYSWLQQADKDIDAGNESIFIEFLKSIKRAEADREAVMVERLIAGAMPGERKRVKKVNADGTTTEEVTETGGDWLAAATYLERRHPERWGRKDRTAITIDETKRITITQVEVIKDYGPGGKVIESEGWELPQIEKGKK